MNTAREKTNMQEERRLFYVGMTRARDELILCVSEKPSIFVRELPNVIMKENADTRRFVPQVEQIRLF